MKIGRKQIISVIIIAIMMFILCNTVKAAASYKVELTGNTTVKAGEQIEITIKVKDIVDIEGGVAGLSAKLEYDETKLEKVGEGQSLNGFMLVEGETIELVKYPGVTTETEIAKFVFKAKANVAGTAEIRLSNVTIANGTETIELGENVTKTVEVTAETNTPIKSSNNNLSSLSVDGKAVTNFNKSTLSYTLSAVANSKTSIKIEAAAEDSKSKITGTGTKNLSVGNNSFNIVVTAEDGTQKTYVIKVERKAAASNNQNNNTSSGTNNLATGTESLKDLPAAGTMDHIVIPSIGLIIVIGIISFIKYKTLKGF
jgi:hypothetical protein